MYQYSYIVKLAVVAVCLESNHNTQEPREEEQEEVTTNERGNRTINNLVSIMASLFALVDTNVISSCDVVGVFLCFVVVDVTTARPNSYVNFKFEIQNS